MPTWTNVQLLLNFNGTDGSTTITDTSSVARSVTASGNAQLDTAQKKFGSSSLLLDGNGDYIEIGGYTGLTLTGDYCIEGWFRVNAFTGGVAEISRFTASAIVHRIYAESTGLSLSSASSIFGATSVSTGTWHHFAWTRSSGTNRLFLNGVEQGTNFSNSTSYTPTTWRFGNYSSSYFDGWLDCIRVTVGEAVYTSNFTPSSTEFLPPSTEGYVAADGPLQAAEVVGTAYATGLVADSSGPLQAFEGLGSIPPSGWVTDSGPLQLPQALGTLAWGLASADGPLQAANVLGSIRYGLAAADGPLQAALVRGHLLYGRSSAEGPLQTSSVVGWHDFGDALGSVVDTYVMDLVTPGGDVRVPISSWQATLQVDAQCYVQCVIPACADWVTDINAATEFVVSRVATTAGGLTVEYEMARAPVDQMTYSQGPSNYTATISGYSDALTADANPSTAYDRTLAGVRSTSTGTGGTRVRCAIDWTLRPAQRAYLGETPLIVDYINYYVTTGNDQYMDVGERA